MKSFAYSLIAVGFILFIFNSCTDNTKPEFIPKVFNGYITRTSDTASYKEIYPSHGKGMKQIPSTISKREASEDIEMLEYLLRTSYSGFEYWQHKGIDFQSYFSHLRDFIGARDTVDVNSFEKELTGILHRILDGHIAIVGSYYNMAYRHKAVYFSDILVEKTKDGLYTVIDSKFNRVKIGDKFTQRDRDKYLYRTLSPPNTYHYLIGVQSFDYVSIMELSFNNKTLRIPCYKNRLLYTKINEGEPFNVRNEKGIPIVRVSSFSDEYYASMKCFMELGSKLKKEDRFIINLLYNGGGSSAYPQTFIENLNGRSEWQISWAKLTSPAITQYFAKYDVNSIPDISPNLKQTILTNARENERYRTKPERNWTFGSNHAGGRQSEYDGTMIILANRRVLSAGEAMLGHSRSIKKRIVIGENTGGVAQFSDALNFYLPNSKIVIILPRQILSIPDLEECVGFMPDYWLDSMEPEKEVLRWLTDPNHYQFKFEDSYDAMLKKYNLAPVLPADLRIVSPGHTIDKKLRAFSGTWSGVADAILDHLIVIERIADDQHVDAVYSWGVAHQFHIDQPGWQRFHGGFKGNSLILSSESKTIKLTCTLQSDGTMEEIYERPGVPSRSVLSRIVK